MSGRNQEGVRDTSLIPNVELDLPTLQITDDDDHVVELTGVPFPLILRVRADGNFHQGDDVPAQDNDLWEDGGSLTSLPVNGRTAWHFKRQDGGGTVNLYFKLLGSN